MIKTVNNLKSSFKGKIFKSGVQASSVSMKDTTREEVVPAGETKVAVLTSAEDRTFILEKDAKLVLALVFTSWDQAQHTLRVVLQGEGATLSAVGFFIGCQEEFFRYRLNIEHRAPHTKGHTLLRGILSDRSKVDVHGNIYIAEGAVQSDAYLRHNTLLLSGQAHSTTTPALEILADDVKAGHAATVGTTDPESLFYLMSRGVSERAAKDMLVDAFVNEALIRIPDLRAREVAEILVRQALNPNFGGCCGGNCCGGKGEDQAGKGEVC